MIDILNKGKFLLQKVSKIRIPKQEKSRRNFEMALSKILLGMLEDFKKDWDNNLYRDLFKY